MYLVLTSKSPRRKEILTKAGYNVKVDISDVDENVTETEPSKKVQAIAKKKGLAVFSKYSDPDVVVLSADTIVVIDDEILVKPKDEEDARRMITKIQGRMHTVYTGVYIQSFRGQDTFVCSTDVYIKSMTSEEIENYIKTTEPYDKAGAYAIQGIFSKYIDKISGDYYNVMGLPINKISEVLNKYNFINDESNNNPKEKEEKKSIEIVCKKCGEVNKMECVFCQKCGTRLEETLVKGECPMCHHINNENDKYCVSCGAYLSDDKPNDVKVVTIDNSKIGKNEKKEFTGKDRSKVGLVLGIITVALDLIIVGAPLALYTGIPGVIISSLNLRALGRNKAIAGLITSIIGIVLSIAFIFVIVIFELNEAVDSLPVPTI